MSQNEFVRQAVLDRIAARRADPEFQKAVQRAVRPTSASSSGSRRRDRPPPDAGGLPHAAAFVLDLPVETVTKTVKLDLAESALHAPQAGWGGVEFSAAAPTSELESLEAEVAAWIEERLRRRAG